MLVLCRRVLLFLGKKSTNTVATRATLFGSDMHQIVCLLILHPRPHWGSYSAPPEPLAGSGVGPLRRGEVDGRRKRAGRGKG